MISFHLLEREFQKERWRLKTQELDTDFMRGVREGLSLAMSMARFIFETTKKGPCNNPNGRPKKVKIP